MNGPDYLQSILLGVIQGLTEFLPVSSSAHLVIFQKLLDFQGDSPAMLLFDVMVHLATLVAVVMVFWNSIVRFNRRLWEECRTSYAGRRTAMLIAMLAIIACVPTAVIGLAFKDTLERAFNSLFSTGVALLVTGALLFMTGRCPRPRRGWRRVGGWRAFLIGLIQGVAILPGISRSGSTISLAIFLGIKRRWAAEFSFLIAVPAILGASIIKIRDTMELRGGPVDAISWGPMMAGSFAAFAVGVLALRWLVRLVLRQRLNWFSYYCWALGLGVLFWDVFGE